MTVSVDQPPVGLLSSVTAALQARVLRFVDGLTRGRAWRARVLLFSVALAYFMAFPSVDVIRSSEFDRTWLALQRQFDAPLEPHVYEPQSHEAKTALRLTVPVFAHVVGMGHRGALLLQIVSGVLVLWLALDVAFVITGDRAIAALCAIGMATTFPGVAAFADDYRGLFDGIAYALLLVAMRTRSAPIVAACVFLAAYTDERALFSSVLLVIWWWLRSEPSGGEGTVTRRSGREWPAMVAIAGAWLAYAVSRQWLVLETGLSTPVGGAADVGVNTFIAQINGFPFGAWSALETLWVPVIGAVVVLVVLGRWVAAAVFALAIAVVLVAANSVTDVTRSAAYVFPAFFVALVVLRQSDGIARLRTLMAACATLAVLVPTYYTGMNEIRWFLPAPLQFVRMLFYSRSAS